MSIVKIDKNEKTPIYIQISKQIRDKILIGTIPDGYTLPSERILSAELAVHRNTITKAYNELKSEGLIESFRGKEYRVTFALEEPESDSGQGKSKKDVTWEAILKTEYSGFTSDFDELYSKSFEKDLISFAGGVAARNVYPPDEIAEAFEKILRRSMDKAYFYTPYKGDPELCSEISKFLKMKGIKANQSNIQIFAENNQALDFILSLMLSPGDKVIIDETMSADVYRTIQLAGGEVVNVPGDEHGMICDNLDEIISKYKPKFIYVDSSFNNPTGAYMTMERKQKILEMSYKYRIPIIEEDEGSDLYYDIEPIPSIKSMDTGNNVIYMYSFSLTMIPGIGVSFAVANKNVIDRFAEMVSLRIANPDWAAQMLMLEYMKSGKFFERLDVFRKDYKAKRDLMCGYLDKLAIRYGLEYRKPEGGVYLWVKLPSRIDARKLLKETQKQGMTFMPGYLFYSRTSMGRNYFRLNFSYPTVERIEKGMQILEQSLTNILS